MAGTVLAALAFTVGGIVALTQYHRTLVDTVNQTVTAAARNVAPAAVRDRLPDPIPMPVSSDVPRMQVLNSHNKVISGDPASSGTRPMYILAPGKAALTTVISHPAGLSAQRAAVYAVRTTGPQGSVTVVAVLSLDQADAKTREATEFAAALCVACLIVVAGVAWLTAGWSLRPVERLRSRVATITTAGDLDQRVPAAGADEIARLGGTLNKMLDSLERSVDRQRRFVADAAHELRTPLAGLSAAMEVTISQLDSARGEELTRDLLEGHRRLGRLVNDLLVLAGLDGQVPARTRRVDLTGVVTDCTRRRTPEGVIIRAGPIVRVFVLGDESQLSRAVTNLIDNALRHAHSAVDVSLVVDAGCAVIAVADDGPGVPVADRERIWDRFVRLDDDRSRVSGGTGLGLAIVKELVVAHDGSISVGDHQPGGGAVFCIRIPALVSAFLQHG